MTQQPHYLRYLEEAKRSELADSLRLEGFSVETEKQVGDVRFDLFAEKEGQERVYEFKSVGSKRLSKDALLQLQQSAKRSGYEFHLVMVNPPPRVNVEVGKLQSELLDYVMNGAISGDLDELSSNTRIDGISDVEISDIRVGDSGIRVKGTGTIDVTLQYGGSSDGTALTDAYPFRFAVLLGQNRSLESVEEFAVDTSSFSE